MPKLTKKEKQILEIAQKGGNDASLVLLDSIHVLQDELDNHIKGMNVMIDELKNKLNEKIKELKTNIPDLNKVLESVRGTQGVQGEKPTKEELLSLIAPLIPEPVKGDTGRTPIHVGKSLPINPQKGDLWYQD